MNDDSESPDSGKTFSAFISYASSDQAKAEEICRSLEDRGFQCWIAPRQVRAGREYGEEIIRGIESSRCLVLVLSEASNESVFVRREVERAVSKRKPVFPVRIEDVMPSPGLELFVSTTHWIDAWSGSLSGHAEHLAEQLGDETVLAEAAKGAAKLAPRQRMPKWIAPAAAVLVIAGVVALVNYLTQGFRDRDGGGNNNMMRGPGTANVSGTTPAGPGLSAEKIFRQSIDATGVDPSSIKPEDISLSASTEFNDLITIQLEPSEQLAKLGIFADKLFLAIGEEGEFSEVGTGMSRSIGFRSIDQKALKQEKRVRLRYDLRDGRSIGPFTYSFDPNALISDMRKREIEDREEWFNTPYAATNISFSPLVGFFDLIKVIRLGKTEDNLDRTIDILPREDEKLSDPHLVFAEQSNYERLVPVPPGLREIFVQLEFIDGTRSTLRKVSLPEQKFCSFQLTPESAEGGPGGDTPPEVYALYGEDVNNKSRDLFALLPFAPRGTKRILHSYDGGSLNAFYPSYYTETSFSSGDSAPTGSTVQFLFQMADGSEQGPYSYKLDGIQEMPLPGFREKMLELKREAVAAFRIQNRNQLIHKVSAGGGGDSTLADLSSNIQRRTWGDLFPYDRDREKKFQDAAPAVILFPVNSAQYRGPYRYWVSVAEIRYGTEKDKLDQSAPVKLTPKEVMENSGGMIREFVWYAILSADTTNLFCKFVFRDGEESPTFSVPIEDL